MQSPSFFNGLDFDSSAINSARVTLSRSDSIPFASLSFNAFILEDRSDFARRLLSEVRRARVTCYAISYADTWTNGFAAALFSEPLP